MLKRTLTHFHLCCGLGSGAAGFSDSKPVLGPVQAEWRCLGGVDVDPAGLRDFQMMTGVPGTLMDLFTREQFTAFHGQQPPAGWKEATAEDLRRAAGNEDPDAVFISSPCKGASGLLSETMSQTPKYRALNELTLRCVWLMCEAWKHKPVKLIVFENVPRLATRGRYLLKGFGKYLVTDYNKPAGTVIAGSTTGQGAFAVADPAYKNWHPNASTQKLRITPWCESAKTVTGSQQVASGALSIADPRPGMSRTKGDAYLTGGHYGVVDYNTPAGAVSASACHDNGRWSVADQRMPAPNDRLTCMITSLDGTWHRPFTTLELAALQSLFDPEDHWSTDPQTAHEIERMQRVRKIEQAGVFMLDGINDGNHRERIGNAVPRSAARAMADVFGMTLLLSEAGETFMLSNVSIWVQPVAIALSVAQQEVGV